MTVTLADLLWWSLAVTVLFATSVLMGLACGAFIGAGKGMD